MGRPLTAAELFDAVGHDYEEVFGRTPSVDEAVRLLPVPLPPHATVLDIGSGTGRPTSASRSPRTRAGTGHPQHHLLPDREGRPDEEHLFVLAQARSYPGRGQAHTPAASFT
ncbi:hypothetical protein [Saccharothrix carnea]|uniref:hypothetical protein n=1 Tax=Saccharothrix carnea TaxID=1280637 RepID=UPI0011B29DCF|nr:hypothetical protein [Saccharothrix carnea]